MVGRYPYGVWSGLRRNGLKLWDIHFRMTRFIAAGCGFIVCNL
ncbi:competence protein comEA [Neisseria polysaccharea ATCC 43768]|nr:competence protein comEA [Neisseria polysaccharea ATCC 43768]EFH21739.1 competence protein comEA [Neisseria polysaccharea ATCC 43768]